VRVLAIVHDADAGPGVFADAMAARGARLEPWDLATGAPPPADPRQYDAALALGGAANPDQEAEHPWLRAEKAVLEQLLASGTPLLGVCLGAELLAEVAGGLTRAAGAPEVGWFRVTVSEAGAEDPVLGPLAPEFQALEWHSYELVPPADAAVLAHSERCVQAFRAGAAAWGIQFHAEVTFTDFASWIEEERSPEERARLGFDADELRARTRRGIERWNELGRALCCRFLEAAVRA
jgi:GMP synthase-like glutamine amidotransferase